MSLRSFTLLPSLLLTAGCALTLVGCGSGLATVNSTEELCSVGTLTSGSSGSPGVKLVPSSGTITLYPGGSVQIPVQLQAIGSAVGNVTLSGFQLPQGITVASVTAPIGNTALVTITAAPNVVNQCFDASTPSIAQADVPLTLQGVTGNGTATAQFDLDIQLGNPNFKPASTNLPIVSIVTAGGAAITSTEDYVNATLTITDAANPSYNYTGPMGIKGRGHSTWQMPKKPYRLNLTSKAPLLGMLSSTNWNLLANFDDKTMLRNDVAMQMSRTFDMFWTPNMKFVEVYLNGAYQGTYDFSETIEVSKARLNIGSIDDTDTSGTDLTGGYLAEIDHYLDATFGFQSTVDLPIGLEDPDPPLAVQAQYFQTNMLAAETSMYASNFTDPSTGWRASWNEPSVLDWFLVEELAGNQDADDWSSDYFYKPRSDARFYRGPVWDMDITFGNDNYGAIESPEVPWTSINSAWYHQLFRDPTFMADMKAEWTRLRPEALLISGYIASEAATVQLAQQNNFGRWPILSERVWPNPQAAGSYAGEVTLMQNWLTQRIAYMDKTYGQ
jgi:hypothetical protein